MRQSSFFTPVFHPLSCDAWLLVLSPLFPGQLAPESPTPERMIHAPSHLGIGLARLQKADNKDICQGSEREKLDETTFSNT